MISDFNRLEQQLRDLGIDFSRLDMTEDEVNQELSDCLNHGLSLKETAQVFLDLIGDHDGGGDRFMRGCHD